MAKRGGEKAIFSLATAAWALSARGRTATNHWSESRGSTTVLQREQWPTLGRIVLLHRVGVVPVGESSVVVVASAPHREEAFAAARFGIDTLKATVPIWKRETWKDGESWGLEAQHITEIDDG